MPAPHNNNVSAEEVAKFDSLAFTWWDPEGPMAALHQINPIRMNFIHKHCDLLGLKAADIGCGGGLLSEALAQQKAQVIGVDASQDVIHVAKEHARTHNLDITYQCDTVEAVAGQQFNQFDIVTCMEMLEHVPDPASVVQACARLLKPGGLFFASTLNRNPRSFLLAIVGAEYITGMVPKGTHDYMKFIRPSELDNWARDAGLHMVDLRGIRYRPLRRDFVLSSDSGVNYLVAYRKD